MHFILCEKEATLDENGFLDLTKPANLNDKWNNLNDEWKKIDNKLHFRRSNKTTNS